MNRATPKKYAAALNEISSYINSNYRNYNSSDIRIICLREKVTHLILDHATKLGYFDMENGYAVSNVEHFKPSHGRNVALSITEYQRTMKRPITKVRTESNSHLVRENIASQIKTIKTDPYKASNTTYYELRLFGIPIYSIKSTK